MHVHARPACRYDLFNPIVTCPPGTQLGVFGVADRVLWGVGDGAKRLCQPLPAKEPCAVYSFGSEDRWAGQRQRQRPASHHLHGMLLQALPFLFPWRWRN